MEQFDYGESASDLLKKRKEEEAAVAVEITSPGSFDYGTAADSLIQNRHDSSLNPKIRNAVKKDPATVIKIDGIAKKTGLPKSAIEHDPKEAGAIARAQEIKGALTDAPVTKAFVSKNNNIEAAHDDVENLRLIELIWAGLDWAGKSATKMGSEFAARPEDYLRAIPKGATQFVAAVPGGLADTYDVATNLISYPVLLAMGKEYGEKTGAPELPWWLTPSGVFHSGSDEIKKIGDAVGPENSDFGTDTLAGVGEMAAQIALAIATRGKSAAPFLTSLFGQGVDIASGMVEEAGAKNTPGGDLATVAGGAITAITEKYGLDLLLNKIPAAMTSNIYRILSSAGSEGSQEIIEQVLQNLSALFAYGRDKEKGVVGAALGDGVLYEGGVGGAVGGLMQTALGGGRFARDRLRAKKRTKTILDINNQDTNLRKTAPALYADAQGQYMRGNGITDVEISGKGVQILLQEDDSAFDLAGADEIQEAAEADIPATITPEQFWSLPQETIEKIAPHTSFAAGQMSEQEETEIEGLIEEFGGPPTEAEVLAAAEQVNPEDQIFKDVYDQLIAAGATDADAGPKAAQMAATFNIFGQKAGVDPIKIAERFMPSIKKQLPEFYTSYTPDAQDYMIERAKRASGKPDQKALGQSLLEFIAQRGGIIDKDGELNRDDLAAWQKSNPFIKKLLQNTPEDVGGDLLGGTTPDNILDLMPDYVREAAVEAGYLEEGADINTLLAAIGDELGGNPTYSIAEQDADALAEAEAVADLLEYMGRNDIDLSQDTRSIKAQIENLQKSPIAGLTLEQLSIREGIVFRGDGVALYTPNRFDREFSKSAYAHEDDTSKRSIAFINPRDFIAATTTPDGEITPEDIRRESRTLDVDDLPDSAMYLRVSDDGKVVDHEGRHRMQAFADAGILQIPVILEHEGAGKHDASRSKTFVGQYKESSPVTVTKVIPLDYDHAEEARELFSGEAQDAQVLFQPGTAAFDSWFGDSKVKTEDGPTEVYHGTANTFDRFDTMDFGSWFAEDKATAEGYQDGTGPGGSPQIIKTYLSIKNPFSIPESLDLSETTSVGEFLAAVNAENGTSITAAQIGFSEDYEGNAHEWSASEPKFMEAVKAAGFDGMKAYETGGVTWNAFEPTQIKSVDNRGTFDQNDPRILYQSELDIETRAFKAWFRNSKALTEDGQPMPLYHITPADIDEFIPGGPNLGVFSETGPEVDPNDSGRGIWLSPDPANIPAAHRVGGFPDANVGGGYKYKDGTNVLPVYASIQSPFIIDDDTSREFARTVYGPEFPFLISDEARAKLLEDGYDGIIVTKDTGHQEFVVLEPTQIKSVFNRGTFDPNDERILYQSAVPIQSRPLKLEGTGPHGRVLNWDLATALTERHMEKYGRALDPSDPADFKIVSADMLREFKNQQLEQDGGEGWYVEDIAQAIAVTRNIIPELDPKKTNRAAAHRDLFLTLAALTSPQQKPKQNWENAILAMQGFTKTGKIALDKGNGVNFGVPAQKTGIQLMQHLIDQHGLEGALEWVRSPKTGREIAEMRRDSGLFHPKNDKLQSYLASETNLTATYPGIAMMGPKVGEFMQNATGFDQSAVTVDLWLTKTYNRLVGRLQDVSAQEAENKEPKSAPRGLSERALIKALVTDVAEKAGIDPSAMQAALWYFEQRLYRNHGINSDSQNFSGAAEAAAEKRGISINTGTGGNVQRISQDVSDVLQDQGLDQNVEQDSRTVFARGQGDFFGGDSDNNQNLPASDPATEEGRKLVAKFVAGVREPGGKDVALSNEELVTVAFAIASKVQTRSSLGAGSAGQVQGRYSGGIAGSGNLIDQYLLIDYRAAGRKLFRSPKKFIAWLNADEKNGRKTFSHETGHLIDNKNRGNTVDEARNRDLARFPDGVVSDLKLLSMKRRPKLWGSDKEVSERYGRSAKSMDRYRLDPGELFADGIAEYMNNPKETKESAPAFSKFLREAVNDDSTLNTIIQFNQVDDNKSEARGSITFNKNLDEIVINLFKSENLSTFLHESGHLYLEMMSELSQIPSANQSLRDDMQAVRDWLGVAPGEAFSTEHHEKWAETYEAYLKEGNAPSVALLSAFAKFSSWLTVIYDKLGGKLPRADLNDEIRGVMDRMMASQEQISQARGFASMEPMFADADMAGVTPEQYERYILEKEREQGSQTAELVARTLQDVKRENTKWWKAESKKLAGQIEEELDQDNTWRTLFIIRRNTLPSGAAIPAFLPDGGVKLDKKAVADMDDENTFRYLPKGLLVDDGMHPDDAARLYGFESGSEMLKSFMAMPKDKNGKFLTQKQFAKAEAQNRMLDKHGDMMTDGTMHEEALLRVHSENQSRLIAKELKWLVLKEAKKNNAETGKSRTVDSKMAKAAAKRIVSKKNVGQVLSPNKFLNAEMKAAKQSMAATLKGDFQAATEAKQRQLLNFHLYREARLAGEKSAKMATALSKLQRDIINPKTVHPDFITQVKTLLSNVSFGKKAGPGRIKTLQGKAFDSFVADSEKKYGASFSISPELDRALSNDNYQDMTFSELEGLFETVNSVMAQGRKFSKSANEDFMAFLDELGLSVDENATQKLSEPDEARFMQGLRSWGKQFIANHRQINSLSLELDGYKEGGYVTQNVFRRVKDADDKYLDRGMRASEKLNEILSVYSKAELMSFYHKREIPGFGQSLSKSGALSVALNMGNTGNAEVMLNTYTEAQIDAVLKTLTDKDWNVVEAMWKHIDSYWEDTVDENGNVIAEGLSTVEKRVTGVKPKKVSAVPYTTPSGRVVTGGYYPLVADPRTSNAGRKDMEARTSLEGLMAGGHSKASTKHGSTIERQGWGNERKLMLDISVAFNHVDGVIKDIELREAVVDVNRIIESRQFRETVASAKGLEFHQQFGNWLKEVAGGDKTPIDPLEKLVSYARTGASIAEMGLSIRTMLQQPFGITQTIVLIGEVHTSKGLWEFARDRSLAARKVMELSSFMRNRGATFNRDVKDAQKMIGVKGLHDDLVAASFWGIQKLDMAVSIPSWLGAYGKAQGEGMNVPDSVAYADSIVARGQGSGLARDLSQNQQGPIYKKMFTMFYTFFNAYYNVQADLYKMTDFRNLPQIIKYLKNQLWVTVIPSLVVDALFNGGPDDDEDAWAWAAKTTAGFAAGGGVFARDIVNSATSGYRYQVSPVQGLMGKSLMAFQKLKGGDSMDVTDVASLAMALGYAIHLPGARTFSRAATVIDDEGTGNLDEFEGWWRLLVQGKKK